MASSEYLNNRKYYGRPQAMLFSNNPGSVENGFYVPDGEEFNDFLILSDHNREPISFSQQRIENRVRTVNGRMRSYHIADKVIISTRWQNLPSRSASSRILGNRIGANGSMCSKTILFSLVSVEIISNSPLAELININITLTKKAILTNPKAAPASLFIKLS